MLSFSLLVNRFYLSKKKVNLSLFSFENHLFVSFKELHLSVSTNSTIVRLISSEINSSSNFLLICFTLISSKIDIITTAYQLRDYLDKFELELSKETSRKICKIIDSFVNNHIRSFFLYFVISRKIKKAQFAKSLLYSQNWIVNKFKFLSNIKKFYRSFLNYQKTDKFVEFSNESLFSEFSWNRFSSQHSIDSINEIIFTLIIKSRQHRSYNDLNNFNNLDLKRFLKHFRSLSNKLLFFLKEQFSTIESITNISKNMTKSDQNINNNRDNEKSNSRNIFEHNNSINIEENELSENQKTDTKWIEILQQDWHSLQSTIQFMNFINQIFQATLQAFQTNIANQSQSQLTSIAELFAQSSKHIDLKWNAFELRFFDSLYDEKSAVIGNVIENFDKNTYFRDIHIFIERIKNIAQIKNDTIVRNNLYICLRETVLTWYISNLKENQKKLIKLSNKMNE